MGLALNFARFYAKVWNVDTAVDFGLDILGRIVDVGRLLQVPSNQTTFGFKGSGLQPFNQAPFYNPQSDTQSFELPDEAYRILVLAKAFANVSATNAPTLNALIQQLFPNRGRCYTMDLGGMAMRYVFEFQLTDVEYSILTRSNVMPSPAGVRVDVLSLVPATTFGFAGSGLQPFGQGNFYNALTT